MTPELLAVKNLLEALENFAKRGACTKLTQYDWGEFYKDVKALQIQVSDFVQDKLLQELTENNKEDSSGA